ncbi:MAG: nucleotidyltransferase substrate binding protein [Candidatus Moeniiplasma glomeromycotorum]|nr:nucleotidyltransferase substrate binding protein [Candidatus Moeniiplasma glomeromycotorum]MCE8167696.1 nucleotidyltransferase substrate binding protein [Candidatus Moeniiplasma glomeromycotorum]MCE8169245.1 nucleotidyltransferase substrate binding protein [Candidatus Moeniiplasma glomeromycotorum]
MAKYILEKTIDIQPLLNMKKLLQKILNEAESEIEQMAAVQAFEVGYELSWKLLKKVLSYQGIEARFPREVFRLAAQGGLIKDPKIWFKFWEKRNITVHTYDVNVLNDIFSILPRFLKKVEDLIKTLQKFK